MLEEAKNKKKGITLQAVEEKDEKLLNLEDDMALISKKISKAHEERSIEERAK